MSVEDERSHPGMKPPMPDPKFTGHSGFRNVFDEEGTAVPRSDSVTCLIPHPTLRIEAIARSLGLETDMGLKFLKVALEGVQLFDRKQRDYGSGNIASFGEFGVVVRLSDKLARLQNLLKKGGDPAVLDEPLEDTWKDISVYGLIGFLVRKGLWK